MVGWHHRLDGHELEQALGAGDGQGILVCYSPWGHTELDMTERVSLTEPIPSSRHGTTDWFQIGKGVCQGCVLSSCLFNVYAEYIMRNAGLEEAQAGIKNAGRNNNNLDMQMTPYLWQKVKRN